ncbi:hypothetical protein [Luteitalea sp. TBR-22]|uniref:hypothetical protein n=1 Tax=Luteitalea sp. TBR-22 TaxID=2802971 RepID=UPI001AF4D1D4|nr:hypothetical protein [Luteitalea sp. TBR-22]
MSTPPPLPQDITALQKHLCVACGAQAEWNASRQRLVCPFCGTESSYVAPAGTGPIAELDLARALAEAGDDQRGWRAETRSVQCRSCKAVMVYEPSRVGQNCEFCGSPALVDYADVKPPITPSSLLPFRVSEAQVRETVRHWFASKWLAPNAFKRKALVDTLHGLYIPYWTFDARVHCPWQAEAGYYHYVKQGNNTVRRVRWEPAAGVVDHFFDDTLVPGTAGIDRGLLAQIEPFPTQELLPYDTAYLSGHVVEQYQVALPDAAAFGGQQMEVAVREMCIAQIHGDTYQNLRMMPSWSGRTFKHVLVPVYVMTYMYRAQSYQLVVNGSNGRMGGTYPVSWVKVALIIVAILIVLAYVNR